MCTKLSFVCSSHNLSVHVEEHSLQNIGGHSSPSPSHLPTDSVQSVYSSIAGLTRGTDGAEISNQVSTPTRI